MADSSSLSCGATAIQVMNEPAGEEGDFLQAIERFTEAITLDHSNHTLFSNRSAAYARVGKFSEALKDAQRCHELKRDWPKSYYRLGVALQGLERHEDAMVAFAEGLAIDAKSAPLLSGLTQTMLSSLLKAKFQPKLEKFESLKLDKNPFIITSVIGQELQTANRMEPAVRILEAARAIGTDSLKLEASLLQALGRVHWILGNTDKALEYMEKDLSINVTLEDNLGCCRAHESLGTALFSLGRYEDAVEHYTQQHRRAQNLDLREAISALNRLGQTLVKMKNYVAALKAYKDSLKISKEVGDQNLIARAYSHLGSTHISAQDVEKAIMWHHQHLTFAKEIQSKSEEAEAYGHLGNACFLKNNFEQSMMFYQQLLSVAVQLNDLTLKARAYGGMGQANRAMGNLWHAQSCREQQLKISKDLGDNKSQLTALNHLGHIHKAAGKLSQAMQCYTECLELAQKVKDRAGEGRAYANLGSCHMALGSYRDAVNYFQQELVISQERGDKVSEATTLGHLGSTFLALDSRQAAQEHMQNSLKLAEEIGDKVVQCHALSNLGNYHTSTKRHSEALPCLERALQLAQELKDTTTESKVCHNLGLCHEGLGHYRQAIQYYQHDFMVAKEAQDKEGMTRACEKLMRAYSENGDKEQADAYKKKLHTIAEEIQNTSGKCTFWNQIAEDALNTGDYDKAVEYYENLLKEAKKEQHQSFEGLAYCGLGNACLSRGDFEHALSYHRRDLSLRKAARDTTGECQAYGNMGAAYNSLSQHQQAVECYEHQLALAKQLENPVLMTKAYGCLGIVHRNMKSFQKALQYHQLQLQTSLQLKDNLLEQANSYANLGDSFEAVGDFQQAVRQHEQYLSLSQRAHNDGSQMRALSSLGRAHRGLGNLRRALGYFERQLKLSKAAGDEYIEAECYADIGGIHMLIGDYNLALESFSSQLALSRSLEDLFSEAMAACGLGEVHARLGNFREAIDYHKLDHRISSANRFLDGEARALGNIAETYESMGEYKGAIDYREKQLSAADTLRDNFSKALAFTGLGKIHIKMNDCARAVSLLKQALSLVVDQTASETNAHTQTEIEVEAKIRFYLGQAFYYQNHFEPALVYLRKGLPLFEHMRQNVGHYDHATKQTLELYPFLFQTLVNTLVRQGKVEEALEMAEMERNRAITDALAQRDVSRQAMKDVGLMKQYTPNSSWIQDAIEAIQSPVLYFAVALNHIYIWMLHPKSGIVQFQQVDMQDFALPGADNASIYSESSSSYVQPLVDSVATVREALGVEQRYRPVKSVGSGISDDLDSGDDNESTIGSTASAPPFRPNNGTARGDSIGMSHHKGTKKPVNMAPVYELYDILIKPMEYVLPQPKSPGGTGGKVIIVPDKDLYLVPFSLLKGEGSSEYLFQRYHLQVVPSLQALIPPTPKPTPKISRKHSLAPRSSRSPSPAAPSLKGGRRSSSPNPLSRNPDSHRLKPRPLLVSNPAIPVSGAHCPWHSLIGVEKETRLLADLLEVKPLSGKAASKENVVRRLGNAECVHFITNVSWEKGQLVLGPPDTGHSDSEDSVDGQGVESRVSGDGIVVGRRGVADGAVNVLPEPREYLLTVSEVMEMRLSAKLVVLSGAHHSDGSRVSSKGLMCLAQAFLCSGVECVVVPLWATSLQASRLMMNAFYSSLMYGSRASRALAYGMQVVQDSSRYSHPANWAGYLLMGRDIVLCDKTEPLVRSMCSMLQASQEDYLVAALRHLQSMITASVKRISQCDGIVEPKYSTRLAVERKVGVVPGWEELLTATGFHFIHQIKKDVPATIVYPEHDDSGIQHKCKQQLDALLSIPHCLHSLSSLIKHPTSARPVLTALHSAKGSVETTEGARRGVKVQLEQEVWSSPGCSEFFGQLGFKPVPQHTSESPWVTLQAPATTVDRRTLQSAITSLHAVFGPQDGTNLITSSHKSPPAISEQEVL